jgi:hypothetical protein
LSVTVHAPSQDPLRGSPDPTSSVRPSPLIL